MAQMLFAEDVQLVFKNFSGKEGQYNEEGVRSFAVVLNDPDLVQTLLNDGWNVKQFKHIEEGDAPSWYLPVAVSYRKIPPRIEMITEGNKPEPLTESNVGNLDYEKIIKADVYIAPSVYENRITGEQKVKAYLRSMAVFVELDPISAKYGNFQ